MAEPVWLEITGTEAELILRYGYPFPEQTELFEKISGRAGYHDICIDSFSLEIILGDLSRSMRETSNGALLDALDAICTCIETALGR